MKQEHVDEWIETVGHLVKKYGTLSVRAAYANLCSHIGVCRAELEMYREKYGELEE